MANLVSNKTAQRWDSAANIIENMATQVKGPTRRRPRSPGSSGTSNFILKITAPGANVNTYTATIINNRTDQTTVETGVTLKALDHDAGTIPNGVILTCTFDSDNDVYEPTNYSVFYGG